MNLLCLRHRFGDIANGPFFILIDILMGNCTR